MIESFTLSEIYEYDNIRFNTQNHWINEPPLDYYDILEKCKTYNWIDNFRTSYTVINIKYSEIVWMKKAYEIGKFTRKFPETYMDELKDFLFRHKYLDNLFYNKKYFVRTDNTSLKYGQYGNIPYDNLENIIKSLVTSTSKHTPIKENTTKLKLYLIEWIDMNKDKEFRVFVHKNKITGISQQHIYNVNSYLMDLSDDNREKEIIHIIKTINDYFVNTISKNILHLDSYSIDIVLLDDYKPYFIEINPFGKEYSSGSALFGWLQDEKILYGLEDIPNIHFRYTCTK